MSKEYSSKKMKGAVLLAALVCVVCAACFTGAGRGDKEGGMEKISVTNGALPVYQFTLTEGTAFGDYSVITAQFLVDADSYGKTARVRAYGSYPFEFFSDSGDVAFLDFGGGETDKNGPYLVSNVIGSNIGLDSISGSAGPGQWFTLNFPLNGKRHQNYRAANFPAEDAQGDLYFALGLSTGDADNVFSYYIKDVVLRSEDGGKTIAASGSGFERPAFAGYAAAIPQLRREAAAGVTAAPRKKEKGGPVQITVDTSARYQQVKGFGGMSNAWNSPELTVDDIDAMYGENGLGYNIFRIILYHEPAQWGGLVEVAKRAQGYGAVILASPWTPPAELKSNNSNAGGYLLPQNYAKYAGHLKSFVQYMADNGVTIDALSFQNEPDIQVSYDSCDWTPEQMLDFVKGYGRAIGDVKIIPGESFQFRRVFTDPLLTDSTALQNFDIIGGHVYGGGIAPYPLAEENGKEVWMTEHLFNTHGNYPYDLTWKAAMTVAKEIHDCMQANFNAYIWWYLKRFYSMVGDGENGSVNGEALRRGYVLSHYAKYATDRQRVGAQTTGNPNVLVTAYESADGVSMVIINMGGTASKAKINLPFAAGKCEGAESSEAGVMRQAAAKLSGGGKTAVLTLAPQSLVSLKFQK